MVYNLDSTHRLQISIIIICVIVVSVPSWLKSNAKRSKGGRQATLSHTTDCNRIWVKAQRYLPLVSPGVSGCL